MLLLVPLALSLSSCGSKASKAESKKGAAAPPVTVEKVTRTAVPLEIRSIGNVEAIAAIQVRPRVGGQILKVHFEEGADVKTGQLLFTIDPAPYQQALRESEAAIAAQQAALGQAEANYERDLATAANARSQANRYGELAAKGIVSRQENEQLSTAATASEKATAASKATIASARAGLQGAQARLSEARLQLSYTSITAPISGRTGSLAYRAGDLVTANANPPMITINQVTPIYVTFSIPEQDLANLRRYADRGRLTVNATPQGNIQPFQGTLDFLDNRVDTGTGTILLKAKFPNAERRLWPGQFVDVAIQLANPEEVVVPLAAVRNAQNGNYVFIVKPDLTAEQRTIVTSRTHGKLAVISKGLNPGDTVITEGHMRVRPNTKVQVSPGAAQASK
ncbi:MAG: efflux RND transporter periplasmic adaptor subunit [Bryobacterales bacterium]|nr:efflux RND transporter periplasmic adaptor subunit [Bryobacterales bacterium]